MKRAHLPISCVAVRECQAKNVTFFYTQTSMCTCQSFSRLTCILKRLAYSMHTNVSLMFFTVAYLMITKNVPLDLECFLLDFVDLVDEQAVYESSSDDALEHAMHRPVIFRRGREREHVLDGPRLTTCLVLIIKHA